MVVSNESSRRKNNGLELQKKVRSTKLLRQERGELIETNYAQRGLIAFHRSSANRRTLN